MTKTVVLDGVSHEFPDDATDEEVRSALESHAPGPTPEQVQQAHNGYEEFRKAHPWLTAIPDTLQGIGAGVLSTVRGASQIAHKVVPAIPEVPASYAEAPDSIAGSAGKFLEQAGEFALPVGEAAAALKGAGQATRLLGKAGAAGGVGLVQSGGDPGAALLAAGTEGAIGAAGIGASTAGRAFAEKVLRSSPRPLSQAVINLARQYGIQLDQGAIGGSRTVQGVQKILGSTVAPDVYEPMIEGQQQGLNHAATGLANGLSTDRFAAGESTAKRLAGYAADRATAARGAYDSLEAIEADPKHLSTVTTGTGASSLIDPATGQVAQVPVTENIPLPVDMRDAKAQLAPIRDAIMKQLPVGQQQYSKGLQAIQNILDGKDHVSASTADANLSAVKQIQREAVDSKVKFLANRALEAVSPAVDDAVAKGGPQATAALKTARAAWKDRSATLDLLESLGSDGEGKGGQVALSNKLLRPADASYPDLQRVLAVAPQAGKDLGDAYLSDVFRKSVEEGGFVNAKSAANRWSQIGPRTKAALYSPEHVADVDSFMTLAKRLAENPNPSNSGMINAMVKAGLLVTHPVQAGMALGFGRPLAKVLYNPEGATALKELLKNPNGKEAGFALSVIKSIAEEGGQAMRREPDISAVITGEGHAQ